MKQYIGIDIGGSFIKYGIVNEQGVVVMSDKRPTRRMESEAVLEDLTEIIMMLKAAYDVEGTGISIPGVINREERLVTSGALSGLYKYDVRAILEERTDSSVYLVNDAKSIGYAENWLGIGKICQNFVCLPIGTGVGGAIIIDGKVLQGRVGAAGEFGLMLMGLGKTDPVGYESGSFHCGAIAGLCRMYNMSLGRKDFKEWETNIQVILEKATAGEVQASEAVQAFYNNVAVLLLNITVSLDPEQIIIGGGISENPTIMNGIKEALARLLDRYTDISAIGLPEISASHLGNHAGMIGAVSKFIERGIK